MEDSAREKIWGFFCEYLIVVSKTAEASRRIVPRRKLSIVGLNPTTIVMVILVFGEVYETLGSVYKTESAQVLSGSPEQVRRRQ